MYKGIKILCIIPARGGSKSLPGKNIKKINGKELIKWTIEQAQSSKYIDYLAVSTDSREIKNVCLKLGCDVIDRPEIYAKDESPSCDAIIHAIWHLYNLNKRFNVIIQLECTSPLRQPDDIDNAIKYFIDNYGHYDTLISLGKLTSDTEHPYCVKLEDDGYIVPFIKDSPPIYQRQQLNDAYSVFGGIYMAKIYQYIQRRTFYMDRILGYKIQRWQKFEIDDEVDFICCEALMKRYL